MKTHDFVVESPRHFAADVISEAGNAGLEALVSELPSLPVDSKVALKIISDHLREKGFSYKEGPVSLADVLESRGGNCLGLSVLVTAILISKGKTSDCKILIHPHDAVDRADKQLFSGLMQGEYFDYDHPILPKVSDQPEIGDRINRFTPLGHPMVMLDGVPLETTLMVEADADPIVEFPAESSITIGSEILESYLLSDQAKLMSSSLDSRTTQSSGVTREFCELIQRSLDIFPDNRDALALKWYCGRVNRDETVQAEAKARLLGFGAVDSDLTYKLWTVTGEVEYLDATLREFSEHIPAFLDRKVFMEPDMREARMNLAVALWCIAYSNTFDLRAFYKDPRIRKKVAELFPRPT